MRAVIQRVNQASVKVDGGEISRIGKGLCCLVGVETGDGERDVDYIARKICGLRVFDDEQGMMNLDVGQVQGEVLLISQFTLLGDTRKGKRPSYFTAEQPDRASELFEDTVRLVSALHSGKVATGRFQAAMEVSIVNNGPVTILMDSRRIF
ncbi:MAG: D-aminoacyl-tRNA deacylase [Desulfomonilia bacterium]|jgi:D-tyrosyl-tRNA(Tyr) deacylase|nr:D-aminoacyl-tRNA deacylase [Deltaproteobacteria bacterium]MDX9762812.1 D-aminoacyl-tRNA deacylase [Desulfomonilia bacterium]HPW68118.1 D-aminoacyl-tRNA deacylase [Deltaproteobacteria bacterium]